MSGRRPHGASRSTGAIKDTIPLTRPRSATTNEPALSEKALQAERRVAALRLAVIVVGTLTYPFLLSHEGTIPWLAYSILALSWAYALVVLTAQPYRRFPVLASSVYTTLSDSLLLMLWIYATGGYDSAYWSIMFLSVLAIAYRYSLTATLVATGLYAVLYLTVVSLLGQWPGHAGVVLVRVSYLGIGAAVAGLMSTHSLQQTKAKLALAEVAENERRLRTEANQALSLLHATLESTTDGLLVVDRSGKIASFNRRFVELWRIPQPILDTGSDEQALKYVLDQLKDPEGFLRKVKELYGQPKMESFDALEFRDGRIFERYSRPQLLGGQAVGRVWSFRDVTARVHAENEREENRRRASELERLQAVDQFKSQFISAAAHELNTPLTPVTLQLHILEGLLKDGRDGDPEHSLELLKRNVQRLSDLVSDLLDASKYQAGRLTLQREPCDLGALVRECVDSFADAAQRGGIGLQAKLSGPIEAFVDAKRITQVLYNLLGNAVKFTPAGGNIHVEATGSPNHVAVQVRDTGTGIPPALIGNLFLPFSQAREPAQANVPGTGLGLYISRGIIEAHGGTIWCRSDGPGKGATFSFSLPRDPPAAQGRTPETAPPASDAQVPPVAKP
jgi:signal transduction histidine kinase